MTLTQETIGKILKEVESRKISSQKAFGKLQNLAYETFSFARMDHHRTLRKGFPEAIYTPGKTIPQLEKIFRSIQKSGQKLIATRLEESVYKTLRKKFPGLRYSKEARIGYFSSVIARSTNGATKQSRPEIASSLPTEGTVKGILFSPDASGNRTSALSGTPPRNDREKSIAILTAGTSDLPVAEEAAITLELIGKKVVRIYDCGVAGLHRLLDQVSTLQEVKAVICVAGMEGALPSVVAGLISKPIIAVPTSVGYGASFKGLAALLTMLNSCAQGVACVNIDNGFGAACFAASIA